MWAPYKWPNLPVAPLFPSSSTCNIHQKFNYFSDINVPLPTPLLQLGSLASFLSLTHSPRPQFPSSHTLKPPSPRHSPFRRYLLSLSIGKSLTRHLNSSFLIPYILLLTPILISLYSPLLSHVFSSPFSSAPSSLPAKPLHPPPPTLKLNFPARKVAANWRPKLLP